MLPGQIVDDDADEEADGEGVKNKTRNRKIEETGYDPILQELGLSREPESAVAE